MYYSVLGYRENPLIADYASRYLQKLRVIFASLESLPTGLKKDFESLSDKEQQEFIFHPDISSLLQETVITNSKPSEKKFIEELQKFCMGESAGLTMNQGRSIPGTNIKLTDKDNNPNNDIACHPGHSNEGGGIVGWGDKNEDEWLEIFGKAFAVLKIANEDFFDELNSIIKKIVPMKTAVDVHHSCSYKECIGTLYLGYTTNTAYPEINILEALVHESSHNKLNLIMQSQDLYTNDFVEKYYSPYRPDARHIHGVYLGVHAIIPTIHVMLEAIEKGCIQDLGWYKKVVLFHIKNKLGYRVFQKHAKLTDLGQTIFEDMGRVISLCDQKIKQNKNLQNLDLQEIQAIAKDHFLDVQQNYPHVQY